MGTPRLLREAPERLVDGQPVRLPRHRAGDEERLEAALHAALGLLDCPVDVVHGEHRRQLEALPVRREHFVDELVVRARPGLVELDGLRAAVDEQADVRE